MPKLNVVITSTREGRMGAAIAEWFAGVARQHAGFDVELVDLKAVALPLLDEPNHPMKRNYQHEHTKAWSAIVEAADAFVFVIPEYNYGMPPAMLNALDYLYHEWNYKAAALVSYGGVSAGTRAAQMCKQVLTTLRMMPIPEAVSIPFFTKAMDENGRFDPGETQQAPAAKMLDELLRWTNALQTLRN